MENAVFTPAPWEPEFLVSDADLRSIFGRFTELDDAKQALALWRSAYPNDHIVIFERTSLTTWEGRFVDLRANVEMANVAG